MPTTALNTVQKYFPEVKSVHDARKHVHIEVTRTDEAQATRKNHTVCAFAVACKRKLHLDGVIISSTTAYLIKGHKAMRFKLPESVTREVVSFDRGAQFAPGEYELRHPAPQERLGHARGGSGTPTKNPNRTPRFKHVTSAIRTVLGSKEVS